MKQLIFSVVIVLGILGFSVAKAQTVDLGIQNIPQEMSNWCWVAAAQQIIYWRHGGAPYQCEMVADANNTHPGICCPNNPQCNIPGTMSQIQYLLGRFGMQYSALAPPTDPMTLTNLLAQGRTVIMFVRNSPYQAVGHFVVLRGIHWTPSGPVVLINDPINWSAFSQPVPFQAMIGYWQAAIVI